MSTKHSSTSIKSKPWHGTVEDLNRLVALFLSLQEDAKARFMTEQAKSRESEVQAFEARMDEAAEFFADELKAKKSGYLAHLLKSVNADHVRIGDELALNAMDPKMQVLYKEMDTRDTGDPDRVLNRLNVKQVKEVRLEYGRLHDPKGVGLEVVLAGDGAKATVIGDEMFVSGAVNRLKEVFRQQRPKPWWVREPWFLIPLLMVTTLTIVSWLVRWWQPDGAGSGGAWWTSIAAVIIFCGQWYGIRWLVPGFELLSPNKKSRSEAALAVVGALVLSVVGSILLGILTPGP